jgi:hypothetical protein
VQRADRAPEPTAGHVIDHFGFAVADVDASAAALAAAGVKFAIQPRTVGVLRMAFVEGPDQLRVETVQR